MENKETLPQRQPRRNHRTLYIILASVFTVIIIALAVGLGVGLTRNHHNNSNSNDSSDSGSSSTSGSSSNSSTGGTMGATPSAVTPYINGAYQPPVNASWQIILLTPLDLDMTSQTVTPDVDVWDIDMFTNKNATVDYLHSLGKHVICYFSGGSYEKGRPDSAQFQASEKGNELKGWPGEYWLDLRSDNVRNIMKRRIEYAHGMKCDSIDPDNMDAYNNDNGLNLTMQDSIDYMHFLSETAAQYNISVGLKNAAAIIPDVLNVTAFNVNEQCVQYKECSKFNGYIGANKPVFHIEYPKGEDTNNAQPAASDQVSTICSASGNADGSYKFSTVVKNMNLNGWIETCNQQTAITPCSEAAGKPQGY